MKKLNHLNEQDEVYSEAHAKELLAVKANYNKMLQELNNKLAKQISDLSVKYLKMAQAQQQLAQTQKVAAKTAGTQQPTTTQQQQTGTVNTTGQAVNADGSPVTKESYEGILRIKEVINEETFDTRDADSEVIQDLKNYMDAENISYIEDEEETTLGFDKEELDPEWVDQLEQIGLEPVDDIETNDILDIDDEEESIEDEESNDEESDITNTHKEIDEEKVFYVNVHDADGDFIGKIYKLFDDGEWHTKIISGNSETFEKLNYDPNFDDIDIIAFLRENYDDAELMSKEEYNEKIEEPVEESEIQESHKIQTFEDFLNETS